MGKIIFRLTSAVFYFISLLPFTVLYLFSDLLYLILFYIIKYRRKVVLVNLKNAFPEKSIYELRQIEKKFYRYLADLIFETIKLITISEDEIRKRFVILNLEEITHNLDKGKSVIAISGHYGNWEMGPLASALAFKNKILVVYKPLTDQRFDHLINTIRSRFGTIMVPMKQTLRKIIEYKDQAHLLVLVGDQTPTREESNFFTSFLNQNTAVFLGVEKIAMKTNNPIVFFNIKRIKRGYYECLIKPLVNNPSVTKEYEITKAHTRELEKNIRFEPQYWLWSHKRWKFSPKNLKND